MKIYLATPVNGRKEKTLRKKQKAAMQRLDEMAEFLRGKFKDAEFINPVRTILTYHNGAEDHEALIMGSCVKMVMMCDMIILDDGWENSSGCTVERFVAMQYGKKVQTMNYFKMKDKIG